MKTSPFHAYLNIYGLWEKKIKVFHEKIMEKKRWDYKVHGQKISVFFIQRKKKGLKKLCYNDGIPLIEYTFKSCLGADTITPYFQKKKKSMEEKRKAVKIKCFYKSANITLENEQNCIAIKNKCEFKKFLKKSLLLFQLILLSEIAKKQKVMR